MVTVGGFFTSTVFVVENVPQALVIDSLIVYVPALLKMKEGLTDVALVELVKLHEELVPQFAET